MAYSVPLADRVRELLAAAGQPVEEKPMFSGLCFMVNGKMCVGVQKESIMLRIDPELTDKVLEKDGCRPMVHGGKVMPGFVYVEERALTSKRQLDAWIKLALDFNPRAKATKKKK